MAEIPSDIASSAAPAGYQGKEVAKEREARKAGAADTAERRLRTVGEADGTVEADDADTSVFADAEGTGSQGGSEEETPAAAEGEEGSQGGIIEDEDGQLHLDIEA